MLAEPLESVEEDVQRELEGFKPAPGGAGSSPAAELGTALAAGQESAAAASDLAAGGARIGT